METGCFFFPPIPVFPALFHPSLGARPRRGAAGGDKLFGKRLLQAGRYIMSHKAWMKTVPTENCDVLMTFPDTTDDHTLLWLLNHIRLGIPELIVQVRHHKHTRAYAFFVTATYESLLRGADEIGLRKPVKAEFGGGMRSFSCEEDYIYENIENELGFFTSQERQNIIRYWLENLRAKQGESLHNIHFLEGQPIIPELAARGVIQQLFPLHEQRILKRLMKSWVQAVCEAQPLDDICDYFGVKIAMYFAWLGFYTSAMVYPAVFGSILYTFTDSDQTSQDISCVVFAIFNVIWATLFLEEWKRRGAEFAYKWGTLDTPAESIEEPRPQFRGMKRISPVTSAEEFYYPPWKRLLFQSLVSLPVCLACLCLVFLLMLGCFQLQELVLSIPELPRILRFLPKIILAVIVTACDELYKKVALWLNDMENYRLQSAYEKHLIIKIVLFQFVNSYLSLFYIGFYLKDMERLKELLLILSLSQSLARQLREALLPSILLHLHLSLIFLRRLLLFGWSLGVSKMLATLLITRQFLQNVREVSQPHLYRRLRRGDLNLRSLRQLAHALLCLLAPRRPPQAPAEGSRGEKKCLNGGCGVPEEEEEEEEERRGSDSEEESALDCGLKLKKVSFIERGERRAEPAGPEDEPFLEEGSPTMVEKGMDPAAVFELCEEEDEAEGAPGSPARAATEPAGLARVARRRREEEEGEEEGRKRNRASWIDPPEEDYSTQLTQAEVESCMKKYEDTFQDYQEMFIQFGYVVLFSSAFPLAAMCALVNNVIEIRSDAFKLCTGLQRPFGQRVQSIGQWQKVMEAMGVLAIVVNCYLIAQCGQLQRLFPWLSPEGAIVSVVVLEHFALLLKYVIQVAIPDIPAWVAEEMAKLEYQRREAFKVGPARVASPGCPQGVPKGLGGPQSVPGTRWAPRDVPKVSPGAGGHPGVSSCPVSPSMCPLRCPHAHWPPRGVLVPSVPSMSPCPVSPRCPRAIPMPGVPSMSPHHPCAIPVPGVPSMSPHHPRARCSLDVPSPPPCHPHARCSLDVPSPPPCHPHAQCPLDVPSPSPCHPRAQCPLDVPSPSPCHCHARCPLDVPSPSPCPVSPRCPLTIPVPPPCPVSP
uniref:Anoctamin n=1 Tax=Corvus moneduloides TaxID=1196302 RepID=A0A8C3DHH8_CORMO